MKNLIYLLSIFAFAGAIVINVQTTRAQSPMMEPIISESVVDIEDQMDRDAILVRMTALHTQNTDLLSQAMRNQYSKSPDLEASQQALRVNSQQIAQLVSTEFGSESQAVFEEYWNESMTQFLKYSKGLQQDDKEMQSEALVGLHRNIIQGSRLIAGETNIPEDTLDQALRSHVNNLRGVIESYDRGQFADSYSQQMIAQEQISQIAQALTNEWLQ